MREVSRFVLQYGPDDAVKPCDCGSPFGILAFGGADGAVFLRCMTCGDALDEKMVRYVSVPPERNLKGGHTKCGLRRVVVPRVREEVTDLDFVRTNGAETFGLYCVVCGHHAGSVAKDELRGYQTQRRRRDNNQHQRTEVLERANGRCESCGRFGLPRDVGHCLSVKEGEALGAPRDVVESAWNKCALCIDCNQAASGGYGDRSMSPSVYVTLVFAQGEAQFMINFGSNGPRALNHEFYQVYTWLRKAALWRLSKEAA